MTVVEPLDESPLRSRVASVGARIRGGELGALPVIAGLIVIWGVFQGLNPVFLSSANLVNLTMQCANPYVPAATKAACAAAGVTSFQFGTTNANFPVALTVHPVREQARYVVGASGDFAAAYVIAHEVGHHVQDLLGILDQTDAQARNLPEAQQNAISVRTELQADCFAGIFAKNEENAGYLDVGDFAEAINAAQQIGDDTLERETQGYVVPDSFTHGTSAQRQAWLQRGYDNGTIAACDTFSGNI